MLRKKKDFDKSYCSTCRHHDVSDYCLANPEKVSLEYLAPGRTTFLRQLCGVKNDGNKCPDFNRK